MSSKPIDRESAWNRRRFLQGIGVAFSAAVLSKTVGCTVSTAPSSTGASGLPLSITPSFFVRAIRPEDMTILDIAFVNLRVAGGQLVAGPSSDASYIILGLGAQHVLEPVPGWFHPSPSPSYLSGPTRLVFLTPLAILPIDYSLGGILEACARSQTSVSANAQTGPIAIGIDRPTALTAMRTSSAAKASYREQRARMAMRRASPSAIASALGITTGWPPFAPPRGIPVAPASGETSIELPTRLILSPDEYSKWQHEDAPFVSPSSQRSELWRTHLSSTNTNGIALEAARSYTTVRAIWTRDSSFDPYTPPPDLVDPVPTSYTSAIDGDPLDQSRRESLVKLTSDWSNGKAPAAIRCDQLDLSALGGFLQARAGFDSPAGKLASWIQRITLGRDQYVATSSRGYLAPYDHRATKITIAERVIDDSGRATYLDVHAVIVIDEAQVAFDAPGAPFRSVEILITQTDPLTDGPEGTQFLAATGEVAMLQARGVDQLWNSVSFSFPICFSKGRKTAADLFNAQPEPLRTIQLNRQRVGFAASSKADTAYETRAIVLSARCSSDASPIRPSMVSATIAVEAIRHLIDGAADVTVRYAEPYLRYGLPIDPAAIAGHLNANEVLFALDSALPASFGGKGDRTGGVITPDLNVVGISRKLGLLSASATDATGMADALTHAATNFSPASFFGGGAGLSPKLFGVLDLKTLVKDLDADKLAEAAQKQATSMMPKFVTEALDAVARLVSEAENFKQRLATLPDLALRYGDKLSDPLKAFFAKAKTLADAIEKMLIDVHTGASTGDFYPLTGIPNLLEASPEPPRGGSSAANAIKALSDVVTGLAAVNVPGTPFDLQIPAGVQRDLKSFAAKLQSLLGMLKDVAAAADQIRKGLEAAKDMTVKLEWRPAIQPFPDAANAIFTPHDEHGLFLSLEVRGKSRFDPKTGQTLPAGMDVLASLENFALTLLGASDPAISFMFRKLVVDIKAQKKPEVDVVYDGLKFGGSLKLLNKLKDLIPLDGFSDPPFVDVGVEGITAGFTIAPPSLSLGLFTLKNINLGASITLPFLGGGLGWEFHFCTKKQPFNLTVGIFGGGGFLSLVGSANGLDEIHGSLEFGAYLAIDLDVASAEMSIAAGAYLDWDLAKKKTQFTGFLRLRGALHALGCTLSIELRASIAYDSGKHDLWVKAELNVQLEIGPFSPSITLGFEKHFDLGDGGGAASSRPLLVSSPMKHDPAAWTNYLNAFARAA